MSISVEINGSVASIVLSGAIDYGTQEEFKSANQQALSIVGVKEIRVDFAKVNFLDSSGIRALLTLQKGANAAGKALTLMNCNKNMLDIFEIGGFDKIFSLH